LCFKGLLHRAAPSDLSHPPSDFCDKKKRFQARACFLYRKRWKNGIPVADFRQWNVYIKQGMKAIP
jgi:hypothetical protein